MNKEIYVKKQELNKKSQNLTVAKFDLNLKRETITRLIEEQDKIYKQYTFYKEYLKACNKEKRR